MEALAEEATGMGRQAVIMGRQRTAGLMLGPDRREIPTFRGIAGERPALALRFAGGCLERHFAAALACEPVGANPAAGKIVGGEFPDW